MKKLKYIKEYNAFGHEQYNSDMQGSPFAKNYGEEYPMDKVKIDQIVSYKGKSSEVIKNDGNIITLSDGRTINKQEFVNKCCIRKEDLI
jgi:hypothetical protein